MNSNHRPPSEKELAESRLTAYALDQLDPAERRAVEAELAAWPAAREAVDQIRALAGQVREAAALDAAPEPSPTLRAAVQERLSQPKDAPTPVTKTWSPMKRKHASRRRWIALAVCLAIAAIPLYYTGTLINPTSREVAMNQPGPDNREEASPDALKKAGKRTDELRHELKILSSLAGAQRSAESDPDALSADYDSVTNFTPLTFRPARRGDEGSGGAMPGGGPVPAPAARGSQHGQDVLFTGRGGVGAGEQGSMEMGAGMEGLGVAKSQYGGYPAVPTGAGSASLPAPASQPRVGGGKPTSQAQDTSSLFGDAFTIGVEVNRGLERAQPGSGTPQSQLTDLVAQQVKKHDAGSRFQVGGELPVGVAVGQKTPRLPHVTDETSHSFAVGPQLAENLQQAPGGVTVLIADGSTRFFSETVDQDAYDKLLAHRPPMVPEAHEGPGMSPRVPHYPSTPGTEQYDQIVENPFLLVGKCPLSTFAVDVDTASYANVRRFLNQGRWPPPAAVRIEEMVNYFKYDYPSPDDGQPFSVHMEVAQCPWNGKHRLLRIGLKGREIEREQRGPGNLVFLLDVSGSMQDQNKLPLVKQAMRMLVDQLTEDDRVAIVTYASSAAVQLPSTCGESKQTILAAIDSLTAGGSTHGSAGIQMAYQQASEHFVPGGTNRVILATDGDLNVGITEDDDLVQLIQKKAKTGVFLTVLGFGTGNLKDSKLEKLADKGNGTYAYIDGVREARKVLVEQLSGSLVTIAKDVKVQIEFNPAEVRSYRLIGYENRVMAARDFDNDRKDAGEIGAGHTVTALYELVPAREDTPLADAGGPELKYQRVREKPVSELTEAAATGELLTLRLRHKEPDGKQSKLAEFTLKDSGKRFGEASPDFHFAAAVAAFGMVLRDSPHRGDLTLAAVEEFATSGLAADSNGYRAEFLDLVRQARQIADP